MRCSARTCISSRRSDQSTFVIAARWFCAGYDLVSGSLDTEGSPRSAIVFRLVSLADGTEDDDLPGDEDHPPSWYWRQSLEALRETALDPPPGRVEGRQVRRAVYHRSEAVR